MSIKELYRDDLLNRYPSHTFTETVIGSMTLVEFKDGSSDVIGSSQKLVAGDAYVSIREDLVGYVGDVMITATQAQRDAFTGTKHGTMIHQETSGSMECFDGTDWVVNSYEDAITASSTQTQGQGQLTKKLSTVSVVASTNDVVTMPAAYPGLLMYISNSGANVLQVFPSTGDNFINKSVDESITIPANNMRLFFTTNSTQWAYGF